MEKIQQIITNVGGYYADNLCYYAQRLFTDGCVKNPRHNFCHGTDVLEAGYEAARHHEFSEKFGKDKCLALLIAHVLHDIGHSGRMGNDKQEVKRAIEIIRVIILPEHEILLPDIEMFVGGTEFPHDISFPAADASEYIRLGVDIIRDADMTPLFKEDWLQTIVFGLSAEMGITPLQMLREQPTFISDLHFYTSYFQALYNKNVINQKLEEVHTWIKILEKNF